MKQEQEPSYPIHPLQAWFAGRSCDLLGLGVSHTDLAALLVRLGIRLTVRDKKSPEQLGAVAESLRQSGVRFVTGDGCFDRLDADVIIRSPGIRPDLPGIAAAVERGAVLTSEVELLLTLTHTASYGITGSDGKTTTTTLVGKFLEADARRRRSGKVFVGGNIGTPLLPLCDRIGGEDRIVLELSSFQLMCMEHAVTYAAITNLSPNHLDWHRGMEEYAAAKQHIVGAQTRRLVTNADCPATLRIAGELKARHPALSLFLFTSQGAQVAADLLTRTPADRVFYVHEDNICSTGRDGQETALLPVACIRIPGRHNVENFMTAIALTCGQVSPEVFREVAESFLGVEHRLEFVRTLDGVDYYNSSIDSSPTRTAAALSALAGRDIVIICGGYDKKIPFEPLATVLCTHVRAVVLTGATAPKIASVLQSCPLYRPGAPTVASEPDFAEAVKKARSLARSGGCVLLSPACASFDAFRNFAERGERFKQIVREMKPEEN